MLKCPKSVKFMSIQRPRPQDRPGTARRCIGIIKQVGPEGMRSGDYSAGYGGSEDNGGLSDGYSLPLMCLGETSAIVPQARMTTGMETGSSLSGVALDSVHMRGLPCTPTENDTYNFSPLNPVRVYIETGPDGRVTGGADVEFATHEKAVAAMSKDQANMQHRHIDLFLNSTPGASNGAYSSQVMQGMGVSAQPTYSGLESQSVSGCYGAGY